MTRNDMTKRSWLLGTALGLALIGLNAAPALAVPALRAPAQKAAAAGEKLNWKPVGFAIVRYNDDAPASWNMYHGEKKGLILLRLWRRYLFLNSRTRKSSNSTRKK